MPLLTTENTEKIQRGTEKANSSQPQISRVGTQINFSLTNVLIGISHEINLVVKLLAVNAGVLRGLDFKVFYFLCASPNFLRSSVFPYFDFLMRSMVNQGHIAYTNSTQDF